MQGVSFATRHLPVEERFGLGSQLCRCAVSIPSNIAEGSGRATSKDFVHFLNMAFSSSYELETQIILCENLDFIDKQISESIQNDIRELQKMPYVFKTASPKLSLVSCVSKSCVYSLISLGSCEN